MEDWYELEDDGCCLICENAEPGCLCYNCKCSKCIHYSKNIDPFIDEGFCNLVEKWREEAESEDDRYKIIQRIHESKKAILAVVQDVDTQRPLNQAYWIPKSIIINHIYVPKWFADKTF